MRVLDLFSGVGGWTLGLHRAGYETVAACEIDEWKRAQYQRLWPEIKVYEDVTKLTGAEVVSDCGQIDCIVGSPPCKHISSARAGGQKGVDGDGMFFEAIRLVGEIRPHWCAFENSPHLRTRGADRVLVALEQENYACWPLVVGACHAGAAHKRQRVWIVGRLAESEQGRLAGQSRQSGFLGADPGCAGRREERRSGTRRRREPFEETGRKISGMADYADRKPKRGPINEQVAIMQGAFGVSADSDSQSLRIAELPGQSLKETPVTTNDSARLGPFGASSLGGSIRAYDGLSSRDAERARHAYGDAIVPQIATAIGRAILQAEAALQTEKQS